MKQTKEMRWARWAGFGLQATAHLCAVFSVALVIAVLVTPYTAVLSSYQTAFTNDWMQRETFMRLGLHLGIAASLWAMVYLVIASVREHKREKKRRLIQRARGSVMTETIVILPVWMMLVFGLSQLAVNNIAGTLANVAVYEAARAAWVWKGEGRGTGGGGKETKMARVAAAAVMTPVAPGDFQGNPVLDTEANKMRMALALSHVPLSSTVASVIPSDVASLLAGAGSLSLNTTAEGNKYFWRALDADSFMVRSLKKFTHAYHATSVSVVDTNGRTTAKLTYQLNVVMPVVGPIFGGLKMVGLRWGRYSTFKREYGFKSQSQNPPNGELPASDSTSNPGYSGGNTSSGLKGAVGW